MKKHKLYYIKYYKFLINTELKKNVLKFLKFNTFLNLKIRQKAYLLLDLNFKKNNFNKIKIFCLITGRVRFVVNKFKVSRHTLKKLSNIGYNTGIYRGGW